MFYKVQNVFCHIYEFCLPNQNVKSNKLWEGGGKLTEPRRQLDRYD